MDTLALEFKTRLENMSGEKWSVHCVSENLNYQFACACKGAVIFSDSYALGIKEPSVPLDAQRIYTTWQRL